MRNLIVCCDGTWNTADQKDGGVPAPTNVVRLHHAVADLQDDGHEQAKYYHPGVGTDGGFWNKVAGGSVGAGLGKNIQSAYRWLCGEYRPDDRIFLFGFSRGAYTARSLAGMIACCGVLDLTGLSDSKIWQRVGAAYSKGYRKKEEPETWGDGWGFHQTSAGDPVPIHFLGVWDTVGALGIPDDLELLNLLDNPKRYSFHDTELSDLVAHARHAVALDDQRASYTPTLWNDTDPNRDVQELWFPGVHSDVGGGYLEKGLSDGALRWMIEEAEECGLAFDQGVTRQIKPDCYDVLHGTDRGIGKLLRTQPRSIPCVAQGNRALHPSVLERQGTPPITQGPYRKTVVLGASDHRTMPIYAYERWNDTGIYLEAGVEYELRATGQWLDRKIKCGPAGASDGRFHAGEIAHAAGSLFGKIENTFKKLSGNDRADFVGTRRVEGSPWFALLGAIANGGGPGRDGSVALHETFEIGDGLHYTPKKSGYLYCFANDAWHFYDNNRGSVQLTIARS